MKRAYLKKKKDVHEADINFLINSRKSALKLVKEIPNFIKIECADKNGILSDITKNKISKSKLGKNLSIITRERISLAKTGFKYSQRQIDNMKKGRQNIIYNATSDIKNAISMANSKPIFQYDLEGNFIKEWSSIIEAAKYLNKKEGTSISHCLRGKSKKAYGYKWKYK